MKKRSKSDVSQNSRPTANLGYEVLEKRNLLAADLISTSFDYSDSTGDIRTLAEHVPVQDRFDVLRDVVDVQEEDFFLRTGLVRDDLGFAHLKHQQYHSGIAIEGATYTTHIKDRAVVSVSGSFIDYDAIDSGRSLSEADALSEALDFVDADLYMWESLQHNHNHNHDPNCNCCDCMGGHSHLHLHHHAHDHGTYSDQPPEGELIYLPTEDGNLTLTYKFDVYAVAPLSRQHIFVDATTGSVLETYDQIHHADVPADGTSLYNGTVEFTADDSNNEFRLRQVSDGVETYNLNNGTNYNNATDVTSTSSSFTAADVQTGVQAHYGAEQTLQYFQQEHNRDSYDGNGAVLRSYVSYDTDFVNAFWDGSRMTYGDGNGTTFAPLVSLDIVGHEVAHGVTGNTANLIYQDESGALNESFSDIFGESIENFALGSNDWLIGDDIGIDRSGAFRNMANPNQFGDPDTYFGDFWFTGTGDNGGVHTNSGVQNKWFYLLSEGESGTNDNGDAYDVTGIGIDDAGAIAYRNLAFYLNQSSTYPEAREGALQAAIDIFGEGSAQHLATAEAWDAVGVYAPEGPTFSFSSVNSLGAGVYRGNVADSIQANESIAIPIDIDANQTISFAVTGTAGLTPSIELRSPSGTLLGANTGSLAVLQDIQISESGTFELTITGDSGSAGEFEAVSLLNSSFETETIDGTSNNTIADAQSLESSSVSFGSDGTVDRLAVTAQLEGQAATFSEGFESGTLGADWTSSSSDAAGRIRVTNEFAAADGDFTLYMDVSQTDTFNLNEAILTVDIDTAQNPVLRFSQAEWSDETHALPATFSGSFDGDGVAISVDGTNWFTLLTGTNNDNPGEYTTHSFDLVEFADSAGITLGDELQVKFQQYDNWNSPSDGRAYDNILVLPQQSANDWFQFDLGANELATITASTVLGGGDVFVGVYDAAGTLLQSGIAADNFSSVVTNFSDSSGGTFYARVDGSLSTQYNLVVTRGAALDVEPNDEANPLAIDNHVGVFGHVSSLAAGASDPDEAENGDRIDGFFEGVTLSNPVGGGGIYAPFAGFAPTGEQVFGASPTGSDGFRELDREFQADFNSLQSTVSIDVGSDDASDVGFLRAYDLQGNLLEEIISGALSEGQSQTLTINRSTPEIAFVIAAGVGTDVTPFDNLTFSSDEADTDFYTVELGTGDVLSIDAYLPGAGPHLFNNGLDQSSSQLIVELFDPDGNLLATDSELIEHTAANSGTFVVKVSANSNEGEYLLRHDIQKATAIEITEVIFGDGTDNRSFVDQVTLEFDGIVDPEQGAFELVQSETGQLVDLEWTIDNSSGSSLVTITFVGSLTEASGSLQDGNYQLSVDGSLLGEANAASYVFGDDETEDFYRYFGDTNGDRNVDIFELLQFRQTYLLADSNANFNANFDNNGDGVVNIFDLLKFRQNYRNPLAYV